MKTNILPKQKKKPGNCETIVKAISFFVIFISLLVIIGWIFDIPILKSISPDWVTMKMSTALSFLLSGIMVYYILKAQKGKEKVAEIVLLISVSFVILIMASFISSTIFNVRTGFEDIFVKEAGEPVKTTTPGRPSFGTMVNFLLVSLAAIFVIFNPNKYKKQVSLVGKLVLTIGAVAVLGYLFDIPLMYYTIENWSTAMALHTAILFMLLGIAIILLKRCRFKKEV